MSDPKTIIDLAIVIPTLNEERFIGRLLDSITRQTVIPKEVVVVDACSEDKTIFEIKKRQAKFSRLRYFKIPRYTVARQRNFGAAKTTASHLLFLDADVVLAQSNLLENYFKELLARKPDVAAATTVPDSSYWKDRLYFQAEDLLFKLSKHFYQVITARNLYIRRNIFDQVGGFDEKVAVGEDSQLVNKVVRSNGKLIFLESVRVHTSPRRVEQEGRRRYALKMLLFGLQIMLRGYRKSRVNYEFGNFTKH